MKVSEAEKTVRFGIFQFDQTAGRLLKNGSVIRLGQQPVQVLSALLERPGEIVSREELRQRLWNEDVFVDFDHGLNKSVQKLRDALNDSAATPLYIETVPRSGYRFIAPIEPSAQPLLTVLAPQSDPRLPPSVPLSSRSPGKVGALFIAVTILLLGTLSWAFARFRNAAAQPIRALAVLPLENLSGDPAQDYFAEGTTDELITELARVPNLRIVSRNSASQNKGTRKSLQQLSAELNVDAIVEGSVTRSGDRIRINAQLLDTRNDRHLWAQSFEGSAADAISLEDTVADAIVLRARLAAAPRAAGLAETRVVPAAAHEAYLRGRYFYDRRDALRSARFFQQAVDLDPGYASAYAGLAAALASEALLAKAPASQVMPQAMQAARKAIALDPDNSEAYTALGSIEVQYSWDWPDAERNLRRALELNPNNSLAHWAYALYLESFGRTAEAVDHMRRAVEIEPLSFFMVRMYATELYYARRYDEAIDQLQRAQEMQPNTVDVVDNWLSKAYEMKKMYPQAVEHDLLELKSISPAANLQGLRAIYQQQGWKAYWKARLDAARPAAGQDVSACQYYDLGVMDLRTGRYDDAFQALHNAAAQRCFWMSNIQVEPVQDPVRNDPRFHGLLQQIKLDNP
jgi:TolB-like protein/DNA-binding winged helix-turn-helix (wHTH) protein/Flp pilus assembly protein TadD